MTAWVAMLMGLEIAKAIPAPCIHSILITLTMHIARLRPTRFAERRMSRVIDIKAGRHVMPLLLYERKELLPNTMNEQLRRKGQFNEKHRII
jgi:hypothetical protein